MPDTWSTTMGWCMPSRMSKQKIRGFIRDLLQWRTATNSGCCEKRGLTMPRSYDRGFFIWQTYCFLLWLQWNSPRNSGTSLRRFRSPRSFIRYSYEKWRVGRSLACSKQTPKGCGPLPTWISPKTWETNQFIWSFSSIRFEAEGVLWTVFPLLARRSI